MYSQCSSIRIFASVPKDSHLRITNKNTKHSIQSMCGIEEDMTFIEIKSSASIDIIRATMLINSAERDN